MLSLSHLNGISALAPIGTRYLVAGKTTSPYWSAWKRSVDSWSAIGSLPALAGQGNSVQMSAYGNYVVVAHTNTPFISFLKRTDDSFVKASNPASLPPADGFFVSVSKDAEYVALSCTGDHGVYIYKRTGDTFALLTTLSLGGYYAENVSMSEDGKYLAVTVRDGGYYYLAVQVYRKEANDSYTLLESSLNSNQGLLYMNPDGTYLYQSSYGAGLIVWQRESDDSYNEIISGAITTKNHCISRDGYIAAYLSTANIFLFKQDGSTLTNMGAADVAPDGAVNSAAWSRDGRMIFFGGIGFINCYKRRGASLVKVTSVSGGNTTGGMSSSGHPFPFDTF